MRLSIYSSGFNPPCSQHYALPLLGLFNRRHQCVVPLWPISNTWSSCHGNIVWCDISGGGWMEVGGYGAYSFIWDGQGLGRHVGFPPFFSSHWFLLSLRFVPLGPSSAPSSLKVMLRAGALCVQLLHSVYFDFMLACESKIQWCVQDGGEAPSLLTCFSV